MVQRRLDLENFWHFLAETQKSFIHIGEGSCNVETTCLPMKNGWISPENPARNLLSFPNQSERSYPLFPDCIQPVVELVGEAYVLGIFTCEKWIFFFTRNF